MNNYPVTVIFGGGGFIGRYLTRVLTKKNHRLIIPTRKPRIVAAIQPQKETNKVFNTPTKYTSKWVSVDLKLINGEKLISNPAGSERNLQPVAIFLFSKL